MRYPLVVGSLLAVFLVTFVIAESASVPLLTDVQPHLGDRSWATALLGVGLLVSDVVLPVPSSAVMVAQGAMFGLLVGALLALLGGTGATMTAYLIGRRSRRMGASAGQSRRADAGRSVDGADMASGR